MRCLPAIPLLAPLLLPLGACQPYRIEHHQRPAYYHKVSETPLPDEVVLDDGTKIVYHTRGQAAPTGSSEEGRQFKAREELEDGTIVLRAVMPQHVLGNLLHCLRDREYELIWDQMLSEQTKMVYADEGRSKADFVMWCEAHRIELAKTTNRLLLGMSSGDTVVEHVQPGVIECRFWPQIAVQFKFTSVLLTQNRVELGLKLLLIR